MVACRWRCFAIGVHNAERDTGGELVAVMPRPWQSGGCAQSTSPGVEARRAQCSKRTAPEHSRDETCRSYGTVVWQEPEAGKDAHGSPPTADLPHHSSLHTHRVQSELAGLCDCGPASASAHARGQYTDTHAPTTPDTRGGAAPSQEPPASQHRPTPRRARCT